MPFHWYLFVVEANSCFIFLAWKGQSSLRAQVVKTPWFSCLKNLCVSCLVPLSVK
jgi:hypothetical protein